MVTVKNIRILRGITNKLELVQPTDQPPYELGKTIVPIFIVNDDGEEVTNLGTATAGNVEFTFTVPNGEIWEILNFRMICINDATVVNRRPITELRLGGNVIFNFLGATSAASVTWTFNAFLGGTQGVQAGQSEQTSMVRYLPSNSIFAVSLSNGQVGDSFTPTLSYRIHKVAE